VILLLLAYTLTSQPPAAMPMMPSEPAVIEDPNWVQLPTGADFIAAFPKAAIEQRASGEAVIECRVAAEGRLGDCAVLSETPAQYGFGEATLALAEHFRMAPQSLSGEPVDGALVRLPMVWKLN